MTDTLRGAEKSENISADKKCILCDYPAKLSFIVKGKRYYKCGCCSGIFMDSFFYLSKEDERKRYREHNNEVEDPGYQKFVQPVVAKVMDLFGKEDTGLDFGAGTGPVISKLLSDNGYTIKLYDPFFWDDRGKLKDKYDFVVCCEVIEHFHFPAREFNLLRSLLKPRGVLFCMTEVYSEKVDFNSWYYNNDPTHVFFYHKKTLTWVKSRFRFSHLANNGRLTLFFA